MKKWLLAISVLMFGAVFSAGAAEAVYSYSLSWGGLNHPNSVAVDASGNVYVADTNNNRIKQFSPNGNTYSLVLAFGSWGSGNGQFATPWDVAVDASGNIYVSDTGNARIEKFDPGGNYVTQWSYNWY